MKLLKRCILLVMLAMALTSMTALAQEQEATGTDITPTAPAETTPAPTEAPTATPFVPPVEDGHRHEVYCDNQNVCLICDGTVTNGYIVHRDEVIRPEDETTHVWYCSSCGEVTTKVAHRRYCDEDVCQDCGGSYTGDLNVLHYPGADYVYGEDWHELACERCGEASGSGFGYHGTKCNSADKNICEICGAPLSEGQNNLQHSYGDEWAHDEKGHWRTCVWCGDVMSVSAHSAYCTAPNLCYVCGATFTPNEETYIAHKGNRYWDHDELYHWETCTACNGAFAGKKKEHSAFCGELGVCVTCGAEYTGDNVAHEFNGDYVAEGEYHWRRCGRCGEKYGEPEKHWTDCTSVGKLCHVCGAVTSNIYHSPYNSPDGFDDEYHWFTCSACGEYVKEKHQAHPEYRDGYCTICNQPLKDESDTPTDTPTDEPAKEPGASGGHDSDWEDAATATPQPSLDREGFLTRFRNISSDAAAGDLLSGTDTTLTMEANGEAGYDGSVLCVYQASGRSDRVAVSLISRYAPDAMLNFALWQDGIVSVETLRGTDAFRSFVELAQALMQSLLPEKNADEVDALLVALLQSGSNGTLSGSLGAAYFNDDLDGDIVGCLEEEGYVFFLVLRNEGVALLVREAV